MNLLFLGRIGRYLVRELLLAWLAVTFVLIVVLLTNRLVQFLAEAASGELPPELVAQLLGLKALGHLGTVLPASFFLGVILALGRLYRDSEMTAMVACGVGPGRVYRAVYAVAVPLAIAVAAAALYIAPWAETRAETAVARAEQNIRLQGLRPGRFTPLGERGVAYVSRFDDAGRARDLFVWLAGNSEHAVTAASARWQSDPKTGERRILLSDGYRYDAPPNEGAGWRVIEFAGHGIRLPSAGPVDVGGKRDTRATSALLLNPDAANLAELQWRLAMPVVTLILAALAVPLARSSPRDGRYGRLVTAVLAYMVYFNLLKAAQDWTGSGVLPPAVGLWWVHGVFLAVALFAGWRLYGHRRPRKAEAA